MTDKYFDEVAQNLAARMSDDGKLSFDGDHRVREIGLKINGDDYILGYSCEGDFALKLTAV